MTPEQARLLAAKERLVADAWRAPTGPVTDPRVVLATELIAKARRLISAAIDDEPYGVPRRLTQTDTEQGNCWQTAIACILDVDPSAMPDQVAIEQGSEKSSYYGPLQAYLRVHHGMAFINLHGPQLQAVRVEGLHVICGSTVRTATSGKKHCVVGLDGKEHWDPHPSRSGLTTHESWNVLVPFPEEWTSHSNIPCICPSCSARREGDSDFPPDAGGLT